MLRCPESGFSSGLWRLAAGGSYYALSASLVIILPDQIQMKASLVLPS